MKKRIITLVLLTGIVTAVLTTRALTQMGPPNAVSLVAVNPSPGQVAVGGNYTVASGYTFGSVTVNVMPTGGAAGTGGLGTASIDGKGDFTATISVPSGTYDVQAMLTVTDGGGTSYYFFSGVSTGVPVQ